MTDYEMFDVCDVEDVTVIRLRIREIDETKLQRLSHELGTIVDEPQRKRLVIDLGSVAFLTSTGMGTMISLKKKVQAGGGSIKLCSLNPDIRSLFSITQVDRLFDIEENADAAVKSFS